MAYLLINNIKYETVVTLAQILRTHLTKSNYIWNIGLIGLLGALLEVVSLSNLKGSQHWLLISSVELMEDVKLTYANIDNNCVSLKAVQNYKLANMSPLI